MIITGALVYTAQRNFRKLDVRVENGRIIQVGEHLEGGERIEVSGYLIPGLIDIHTHAYGGVDTMDGLDAVLSMSEAYAKIGVTAFLPTTMTGPVEQTQSAVAGIAQAMSSAKGARVLGAHMEGPFIEDKMKGAQNPAYILPPSPENLHMLCGGREDIVRLLTLAPELPGAAETIAYACRHGIAVSAGHTSATYEQTIEAIDRGVTQVTHMFNAMTPLHHRLPGVPAAALLDHRAFVQIIADGVHSHPAILRLVASCREAGVVLITDSMMAAGLSDGMYTLGGQDVVVKDGAARLLDGVLAGSTLLLYQAVRNMVKLAGLPLERVVPMATENAARSLGILDMGRVAAGYHADLTLLSEDLEPAATWIGGKQVYKK